MDALAQARSGSPTRLAVMVSGGGRTLENLLAMIAAGRLSARVVLVIASRECRGAEIARGAGIRTEVIPGVVPASRLEGLLREAAADWVVLAGYLKKLEIPRAFADRIVNIHPALLPEFGGEGMYGQRVHKAVLAAGRGESGCSVHLVTDEYDRGPIVLQARCPVQPGDDAHTLAARVFELEKRAYPEALELLFSGRVQVGEDGRVTILPKP